MNYFMSFFLTENSDKLQYTASWSVVLYHHTLLSSFVMLSETSFNPGDNP